MNGFGVIVNGVDDAVISYTDSSLPKADAVLEEYSATLLPQQQRVYSGLMTATHTKTVAAQGSQKPPPPALTSSWTPSSFPTNACYTSLSDY